MTRRPAAGRRRQAGRHDLARRGRRVRRLAGTRKVGHAGTLDPMATGVLVVGRQPATRLLGHLTLTEKAYDATIRLGAVDHHRRRRGRDRSSTASAGGVTDERRPMRRWRRSSATSSRCPSSVSAIKVDGRRAYARVRAGEEVELQARPVTVARARACTTVARRRRRRRRRRVGALQQRHLRPGDRPRPRRRRSGSGAPHRAATHRGRPFGLADARTLDGPRADRGACSTSPRWPARCFPVARLDAEQAARRPVRPPARRWTSARRSGGGARRRRGLPALYEQRDGARPPRGGLRLTPCGRFRQRWQTGREGDAPCRSGARSTRCPPTSAAPSSPSATSTACTSGTSTSSAGRGRSPTSSGASRSSR